MSNPLKHVPPAERYDIEDIGRTYDLMEDPGRRLEDGTEERGVAECRIPKTGKSGRRSVKVSSGYFEDREAFVRAASHWSGYAEAVYITLNPVLRDLLARACNRMEDWAEFATADADILQRRWLLIDLDPIRPAKISASSEEHRAAHQRAQDLRGWITAQGGPEPIYADSGNGAHLLYRLDCPNDPRHEEKVKGALKALASQFDDERVKVDTGTFNASRVSKVYGTLACKGDSVPEIDRVWRMARLIDVPAVLRPIELGGAPC